MQFFESFSHLGYSAINIVLVFTVILAVIFRSLGIHTKPVRTQLITLLVLMIVAAVPFVMTINFLASENHRLNQSVKDDGGLKRDFPKDPTKP